jgi:hypothetical protein
VAVGGTVARVDAGWLSAAMGAEGHPLIAHFTGTDVAVLACADHACTPPEVPDGDALDLEGPHWSTTTLATGVDHWWDVWEAVPSFDGDGHLVVPDEIDGEIELHICRDGACASARSVVIPAELAYFTAIVPPDGLPVAGADLEGTIVKCLDAECEAVEVNPLEGPEVIWSDVGGDIAVGAGGLPVVAYPNFALDGAPLTVATCADPACGEVAIARLDPTHGAFSRPQIAIGDGGSPVVAYAAWDEVRLAVCADPVCSEAAVTVLDGEGSNDDGPLHLAVGGGGPLVAFTDGSRAVKVAVCGDRDCVAFSVVTLDSAFQAWITGAGVGPNGNPLIAYVADGEAFLAVCAAPDCSLFDILRLDGVARDPSCGHAAFRFAVGDNGLPSIVQVTSGEDGSDDLVVVQCTDPACLDPMGGEA